MLASVLASVLGSGLASATFATPRGGHRAALEVPLTLGATDAGL